MPRIVYIDKKFNADTLTVIDRANVIIEDYQAQGFDLTVRQLHYQFVARGLAPNLTSEYKRLGSIINDARLAGLVDWSAIHDGTRWLRSLAHWQNPRHALNALTEQYRRDSWAGQPYRPEVWIEKDALVGVIQDVCNELEIPYFSCRGYDSQSAMWLAAQRLEGFADLGQEPIIFHLGDHDPSGLDMSRDIQARLDLFMGGVEFKRLALNMDQVRLYAPPPNFAKLTDSRAAAYIRIHGNESWELDALEPTVMAGLIRDAVEGIRNNRLWEADKATIDREKATLAKAALRWVEVETFLNNGREGTA